MSQHSGSPPRSKLPQLAGTKRSPSPSVSIIQRYQDNSSLLSNTLLTQFGSSITRSPSPSVAAMSSAGGIGRSPSPATPGGVAIQQYHHAHPPHHSSSPHSSETPPPPKRRQLFHRELKYMMHGFGDDPNPYSETVELVEELVIQFVTEMTLKAMEVGKSGRVHVNDIIFIIRKDKKKYSRTKDLLMMKEQIDKAKKAFSEDSSDVPI